MANDINFSERIIKRIDSLSFDEKIVLLSKYGIEVKQSDIDRHKLSDGNPKKTETLVVKTVYKKKPALQRMSKAVAASKSVATSGKSQKKKQGQ